MSGLSRPRVKAAPRSRETHPQITRKPGWCHPGRGRACGSQKDLATAGVRDKHAARDFGSNGFNRCYSVSSPRASFIVGNTYAAAAADPRKLSRHKAEAEIEQRMEPPAHVHTRQQPHHHDEDKHASPGWGRWLKKHRRDYHCHQFSNPNHCGKRQQGKKCLQCYQVGL